MQACSSVSYFELPARGGDDGGGYDRVIPVPPSRSCVSFRFFLVVVSYSAEVLACPCNRHAIMRCKG
jgi:hypothetical protein